MLGPKNFFPKKLKVEITKVHKNFRPEKMLCPKKKLVQKKKKIQENQKSVWLKQVGPKRLFVQQMFSTPIQNIWFPKSVPKTNFCLYQL